ncbi:MAG: pilus motility taxis protein HmpF [Xenococcaceae cyanobacterium]
MLYLAEVQKQSKGFMGGLETKLKLLACQRNDQSWSIISGLELITAEEASNFGEGALVTVQLGVNRQVQGKPEIASSRIIGILQGFSRLLEKTKNQEDEIEQWKESLTIQSEELSRREIEMETRLEQLQQLEQESERFEQQRQEIAEAKIEVEHLREEFANKTKELNGAWEQLRGEQQLLATQIKDSQVLDQAQANKIHELINSLSSEVKPQETFKDELSSVFAAINNQQQNLDVHWRKLEENRHSSQKQQEELKQQQAKLFQLEQALEETKISGLEIGKKLEREQKNLENKQELVQILNLQFQNKTNLQEIVERLGIESGKVSLEQKIDLDALSNMPLDQLEKTVANLQQDLEKVARFVNEQEEELSWQCQAVEELEAKIQAASEFDRLTLEQELAEEKEAKRMLDETLVGQRRSLRERHEFLLQHLRILKRRQGIIDFEGGFDSFDLEPVKQELEQQKSSLEMEKQELARELEIIQQNIQNLQQELQANKSQQEAQQKDLHQQSAVCEQLQTQIFQVRASVNFYEQNLQSLQYSLNQVRQALERIENLIVSQFNNDSIENVMTQINQIIQDLTGDISVPVSQN